MLEQISLSLVQLVGQFGYLGVFLASMAESFFIPVPAEVIAFTAGFYARSNGGIPQLIIMFIVTTLGNYVGAGVFFSVCRRLGEKFLPRFIDRWGPFLLISHEEIEKTERLFHKHGTKMVFFSKFVPVVKNLIDFPAGLSKMSFAQYSFYTIAGSFVRNAIFCTIGYFVFEAKDQIFAFFSPVEKLILVVLIILIVVYVFKVVFRIRQLALERKTAAEIQAAETDI